MLGLDALNNFPTVHRISIVGDTLKFVSKLSDTMLAGGKMTLMSEKVFLR